MGRRSNVEKLSDSCRCTAAALVPRTRLPIANKTMIISCPACGTRYVVPETAIGGEGRTVRCAKCKHSWFQEPKPLDLTQQADAGSTNGQTAPASKPAAAAPKPQARPEPKETAAPSVSHWRTKDSPDTSGAAKPAPSSDENGVATAALKAGLAGATAAPAKQEAKPAPAHTQESSADQAFDPAADPLAAESASDPFDNADYDFDDGFDHDEGSRFDYSPPFTRKRNSLKMWTIAAAVFAVLASGTVVTVNYYGLPDWFPITRPTFGIGKDDLELNFPAAQQRKATLESGEEIFEVRGSITNTGEASVGVPNLLIVFRDERNKNVYSWVVAPAKPELAPGETLNVTEAVTDIPVSAKAAEIGWSPN